MFNTDDLGAKNVLITGGAGFIGHNLAIQLAKQGAQVTVIDGLQVNNIGALSLQNDSKLDTKMYLDFAFERLELLRKYGVELVVLDLRDYGAVSAAIQRKKVDVVYHLAAVAHANRSNKNPFATFDHSLRTLENVLDASRESCERFVYFSSSMVYGDFNGVTVDEGTLCDPKGIYGNLKLSGELIVRSYTEVFGLSHTIIRPSALYGERCVSRRVGQAFIENAMKGVDLSINGDGLDELDFTYIGDLVNGAILAGFDSNGQNETFNITYGCGRSIRDLAKLVQERFSGIEIRYQDRDTLMPERGTLSIEKAKRLLGYRPEYPVEKGFKNYIDWYKNRK